MAKDRIRRIESAIDLETLIEISASALLNFDVGRRVRAAADARKRSDRPIICSKCENAVVVPMHWRTTEYHFKHFRTDVDCPWTTEASISIDEASARIFQGQQEGALHRRVKEELGNLLQAFSGVQECWVDQYYKNLAGKRRKPDVRFLLNDRMFVLEIQLATTQRPIITERNQFYLAEGFSLIWVTWNADSQALHKHKASVIDIITDHNDNLFSVDPETFQRSRASGELHLRVHWWDSDICHDKIVTLTDLIYPEERLPYAVERPLQWHEKIKEAWALAAVNEAVKYDALRILWPSLIEHFRFLIGDAKSDPDYDIVSLIYILLSLERNSILGSRQKNLTEMLHTFLTTQNRKRMAKIVEYAANVTGHSELLNRPKTQELLLAAKSIAQVDKNSVEAKIVRGLFPAWTKNPS